jgi:hypothetical protein
MLYKLSGGSALWQGEQGAQRLSQMNNAVSNATNLQSVEDVISYGVARDILNSYETPEARKRFMEIGRNGGKTGRTYTGTYVDEMQLLEGGITPELLKGQWSAVKGLEGDNIAGMIEHFRQMYGLNYHGGAQVWAMYDNAWDAEKNDWKAGYSSESLANEIETYRTTPRYQSDSEKMQTALNKLNDNLVNIGKFKFDETEWAVLQKQQQDVEKIRGKLVHGTSDPDQVLTPLQLPGGNPIDLQPVMAEELYRPRRFWETPDWTKSTQYFLENDQNSRAFLDMAAGETGKSTNDIIEWIIGGRNPNRFDSQFQGFLDTAMVGHDTAIIDKEEYQCYGRFIMATNFRNRLFQGTCIEYQWLCRKL